MTDERMEELASLYVLEILAPVERQAFETALERDPELQAFVSNLRAVRDAMAGAVPAARPAPLLKEKIMAALPTTGKKGPPIVPSPEFSLTRIWLPWALAAAALFLAFVSHQANESRTRALEMGLRTEYARIGELNQVAELLRKETNTLRQAVAALRETNQLANVRIALLGSLLNDSPKAVAVSLWDNQRQSGVFVVQNLKPLPPDRDYQLWVIDPQYQIPVNAGVFQVDSQGNVRVHFKAEKTIVSADKFAVTLEPKGVVPKPTLKNMVLIGG